MKQGLPSDFSRKYLNEFKGSGNIRVGEDRAWKVNFYFDGVNRRSIVTKGWRLFAKEYNLQVGDKCKFEMTQLKPPSFTITINKLQGIFSLFLSLIFIICLFVFFKKIVLLLIYFSLTFQFIRDLFL